MLTEFEALAKVQENIEVGRHILQDHAAGTIDQVYALLDDIWYIIEDRLSELNREEAT